MLLAGESFAWDFGDGTGATGTLTPTHSYADNGDFTVTLTVTDANGGVGTDWLVVTVDNAAPELGAFADQTLTAGETLTISGVLTDAGVLDTQTVVIEWEAGVTETLNLPAASSGFEASHLFATAGSYTVTVTVTDKDGGVAEQSFVVTVNPVEPAFWNFFLPVISK
jgi:PKD repeat protein